MALQGQEWHDARSKARRLRAAVSEAMAVAEQNKYDYEMSQPLQIERGDLELVLAEARAVVRKLESMIGEVDDE